MESEPSKWDTIDYIRVIPAIIIAGIIFYFSSFPNPLPPASPKTLELDINTLLHIAEFGLLSFLVALGFRDKAKDLLLVSITVIFAISDEIHQYFVPNRFFDVYDIIVDTIGVILGFLLFVILQKGSQKYIFKENIPSAAHI